MEIKTVYEMLPIRPEKFPGKNFNRLELWVKHYKSVAKATDWTDQKVIAALPACLTWEVEEFETVPCKYPEKVPGVSASIFETLLDINRENCNSIGLLGQPVASENQLDRSKAGPQKSIFDASVSLVT